MKSITIHGIDSDLDRKLSEKSQNRTVKAILQSVLFPDKKAARREMFSDLFGTWTKSEQEEFEKNIEIFEKTKESD